MRVVSEYLASQSGWKVRVRCTKIWPHPLSILWCWGWAPIILPSSASILGGYWQVRGLPHHYAPRPRPRLPGEFTCKYEISLCKTRDSSGMRNRAGEMSRTWRHLNIFIFFSILMLENRIVYSSTAALCDDDDQDQDLTPAGPCQASCSVWCHWTEDW